MAHISQNYDNSGPQFAALFMGKCSGHGSGGGGSWHPGPVAEQFHLVRVEICHL